MTGEPGATRSERNTPVPRPLPRDLGFTPNGDRPASLPTSPRPSHSSLPAPEPPAPLNLGKLASNVVPSRSGSVLSRGLFLKSDYRFVAHSATAIGRRSPLDPVSGFPHDATAAAPTESGWSGLNLSGASNLREGGLGVWGVSQPTRTGVRSLLSLLQSRRGGATRGSQGKEVAWFVTREEPILYIGALPVFQRLHGGVRELMLASSFAGGQPYVLRESNSESDKPSDAS